MVGKPTATREKVLALAGKEAKRSIILTSNGTHFARLFAGRRGRRGPGAQDLEVDVERTRNEILKSLIKFYAIEADQKAANQQKRSKTPPSAHLAAICRSCQKDELDPVIGRRNEIERVIQVLCRRTKQSGPDREAGVGKPLSPRGWQEIANGNCRNCCATNE